MQPPVGGMCCFFTLHGYLYVVIIASMLKAVFIIKKAASLHSGAVTAEMNRAVSSLRQVGFISGLLSADSAGEAVAAAEKAKAAEAEKAETEAKAAGAEKTEAAEAEKTEAAEAEVRAGLPETLFVCECGSILRDLLDRGAFVIGYAHGDNVGESFSGAPYIVQEPDLVDADSYVKMYERAAGLPWTILETERCIVREFTPEDLDGIYALYDRQACRFLEPPSDDRGREEDILRAYIDRIYGLYGFGHWAVLLKDDPGTLIGRVGYSAITSRQEQEAQALGIPGLDADFGFLIGAGWRGKGIAEEVCRALLQFGLSELGFRCIRADARNDNTASLRLLGKLGFVPLASCLPEKDGVSAEKTLFVYKNHSCV